MCVCVCCQEVLDKTTSTCKDRIVFRDDELSYALGKEAYLYGKWFQDFFRVCSETVPLSGLEIPTSNFDPVTSSSLPSSPLAFPCLHPHWDSSQTIECSRCRCTWWLLQKLQDSCDMLLGLPPLLWSSIFSSGCNSEETGGGIRPKLLSVFAVGSNRWGWVSVADMFSGHAHRRAQFANDLLWLHWFLLLFQHSGREGSYRLMQVVFTRCCKHFLNKKHFLKVLQENLYHRTSYPYIGENTDEETLNKYRLYNYKVCVHTLQTNIIESLFWWM